MRSNDIFRGFPNNLVQFTSLQEIMAGWLDLELGSYNHISDSLHIYKDCYDELSTIEDAHILQNTDSLALPYEESRSIFHNLSSVVDDMISTESTETLRKHSIHRDFPQPYANLLHILCAELLRRRNAIHEAQARAELCQNPLLLKLWNRWMFREHTSVDTRSAEKHPQNSN
jgi:thymidylate synthase